MNTDLTHPTWLQEASETSGIPNLQPEYALKVTRNEWAFLAWFLPRMIQDHRYYADYLLELAALSHFRHRRRDQLNEPEDGKVKIRLHELIALRRMLFLPELPPGANDERQSLLFKIDPLLVGVN